MRKSILEVIRCPKCGGELSSESYVVDSERDQIVEGLLRCDCGLSYPVVRAIPRLLSDAYELFPDFKEKYKEQISKNTNARSVSKSSGEFATQFIRTRDSFGYQWTVYSEMACDFFDNFWNYLKPANSETFKGKVCLDVGCGFGRHIYQAAQSCSIIVGVDVSKAIDSAYQNTYHLTNVHLVQGDIYALPFKKNSFDVVYSIGVLHHLPDTQRGLKELIPMVRDEGRLFIWLYSKTRRFVNMTLEAFRSVTTHLPHPIVRLLSFIGASVDLVMFIWPYRLLRKISVIKDFIEKAAPARIKLYNSYPFQVLEADWFDRLAAPIRRYYNGDEVRDMLIQAGVADIHVSPTGLYGWRGCGIVRSDIEAVHRNTGNELNG